MTRDLGHISDLTESTVTNIDTLLSELENHKLLKCKRIPLYDIAESSALGSIFSG